MHIGLIADGNRRWAKENDKPIKQGHYQGFLTIKDVLLPTLKERPDISALTVYAFSTENWKRSPLEVKNLMDLFQEALSSWSPDLLKKNIRLIHAGRKDRLPNHLLNTLHELETQTKHKTFTLYLCLDYGGLDDIVRAVQSHKKTNEASIEKALDLPPLDLIIRTGGENRLSNFCMWQAAYAEFNFSQKYLPDMQKADFENILNDFTERNRRKGV